MADVYEQERAMAEALEAFKIASGRLLTAWEAMPGDAVADYPAFMPSFDEAALAFAQMQVRPVAFTHDQLGALAKIADNASIGGEPGPVFAIRADLTEGGNMAVEIRTRGRGEGYAFGELVAPDGSTLDRVELNPCLRAADVLNARVDD